MSVAQLNLLDAIKARFNGHATLSRLGRVVVPGDVGGEHRAATLVTMSRGESFDTFGSDIEQWELEFRFGSVSLLADDANDWLEAMMDAFEDANIIWPGFDTAGCRVTGQTGPTREAPMFVAETSVELIIQRHVNLPKNRNAVTS